MFPLQTKTSQIIRQVMPQYSDQVSDRISASMSCVFCGYTVEPVYNGLVLSGHSLLSDQFLKSRLFAHTKAVFVTCIRRPPLLSGRSHPVAVLCLSFFVISTCIKRPPLNGN